MEDGQGVLKKMVARLESLAQGSAVVAKPISVGDLHVVTLCELSLGFGGGGGGGETLTDDKGKVGGSGSGGGGGVSVSPLAVLVVEGREVRLESLCD